MSQVQNLTRGLVVACLLPMLAHSSQAQVAAPLPTKAPANFQSAEVMAAMKKVADWQLANPSRKDPRGWEQGVYYTGVMALADVAAEKIYLDAMLAMGEKNAWQPGRRIYHADDHTVSQTYLRLSERLKNPQMLAPTKERFDAILASPRTPPYSLTGNNSSDMWSWCDALFMAPAAWTQLGVMTNDARYIDFMDKEWWRTTDFLYDKTEHLYFRDRTFFDRKTPNGSKVFWSRGNGWVYAGIARVLTYLPKNHPSRPRYVQLFHEMTDALVKVQGADGLWRASLLDAGQIPQGESSGTGLYSYGLQWGINNGLLEAAKYQPIVNRAWAGLQTKVQASGKLGSIQPVGAAPDAFTEESTDVYGIGAFLLAGSEIFKNLTLREKPATFARLVPERFDDFAWENDLVAFRTYGPAIKTTNGVEDSGIDCWLKRVNYPIIDKWYANDKLGQPYHTDFGEGHDPYHVGSSRGCGGLGIWQGGKLVTSGPYKSSRIVSRTPQKSVFELNYEYNLGGQKIQEIKRVSIELGQRMFALESTFTRGGKPVALDIGIGVTTHNGKATATLNPAAGTMMCWEEIEGFGLGTGVSMAPSRVKSMREVKSDKPDQSHALLLTRTDAKGKVSYFAGYGWEKAGEITSARAWKTYLTQFGARGR